MNNPEKSQEGGFAHVEVCILSSKYVYYQASQSALFSAPSCKAMRLLLLDVAMPALTFWTVLFLGCSILHLLFIWKMSAFQDPLTLLQLKKKKQLILLSYPVAAISNSASNCNFLYYINCVICKSAKSNHRTKAFFFFQRSYDEQYFTKLK